MAQPSSSDWYYTTGFWNQFPETVRYQHRLATDDEDTGWIVHIFRLNGERPFRRALVLNCGNGWLERVLVAEGFVESAVALDVLPDFIEQCRRDAIGMDIEYIQMDVNLIDRHVADGSESVLTREPFDLIVNFSACHHIALLDNVLSTVHRLCRSDALFISWDYMGPHRNQYPWSQWRRIKRANRTLPPALRKPMVYPHLTTLIANDPSEAVQSQRVREVIHRYFDVFHDRDIGGGIAYEVITHNPNFYDGGEARLELGTHVASLLCIDEEHARRDECSGFRYMLARPRAGLDDVEVRRWVDLERDEFERASRRGGRYGRPTVMGWVTDAPGRLHRVLARVPRFRRFLGSIRRTLRRVVARGGAERTPRAR